MQHRTIIIVIIKCSAFEPPKRFRIIKKCTLFEASIFIHIVVKWPCLLFKTGPAGGGWTMVRRSPRTIRLTHPSDDQSTILKLQSSTRVTLPSHDQSNLIFGKHLFNKTPNYLKFPTWKLYPVMTSSSIFQFSSFL